MKLETTKDVRREIKKLGYGLTFQRLSWGRHALFKHLESGDTLTANVFTSEQYERWRKLFEWRRENEAALRKIHLEEDAPDKVYGLLPDS